ncbi:hypothetical protein [Novosphingobium marinum]|uniref:Uncharacterized protein n=1 Tax=Novosphingobium marinum TaxID=1514948 RepID=A0A7Y9XXE4_9SPHN|nr:hypothetical protein [Novosphingobium marinum]NYH95033.1 hypothetical protein [Novosphingobium marinum]
MRTAIRSALKIGTALSLAFGVAACDEDAAKLDTEQFSLFDGVDSMAWPDDGLAAVDPGFYSEYVTEPAPLPVSYPMRTSVPAASYGYAPAYDYAPEAPSYYEPLPESYYASDPGTDAYMFIALAAALGGILGDSPPDYYFDHGGTQPWVWTTGDRYARYAEPIHGGYRYYYYAPDQYRPFFVSDPYYSYGYRGDRLAVIYDRHGRVIDDRRAWRQRHAARAYYTRGSSLYETQRRHPRRGVAADRWASRREIISRDQRRWKRARAERSGWRDWDRRNESLVDARWSRERQARRYAANRFDTWRDNDYRGSAPRFYKEARKSPQVQRAAIRQRAEARIARAQLRRMGEERPNDLRRDRSQRYDRISSARRDVRQAAERREAARERRIERRRDAAFADRADRRRSVARPQRDERRLAQSREQRIERRQSQAREQRAERRQVQARQQRAERRQAQARQQRAERRQAQTRQQRAERRQAQARQQRAERRQAQARQQRAERRQAQARQQRAERRQAQARQQRAERRQAQARQQRAERRQVQARQQRAERRQVQARQQRAERRQVQARQQRAERRQAQARQQRAERRQAQARQQRTERRQVQARQQRAERRQAQARQQRVERRQQQTRQLRRDVVQRDRNRRDRNRTAMR